MFRLEIETSNDAFTELPSEALADMMASLAERLRDGIMPQDGGKLWDYNGNTVGMWSYTRDGGE